MIKKFGLIAVCASVLTTQGLAREESLLARVTVYWPGEGGPHASFNGARLRPGHCAVDPKKISYGSKVYFPDGPCVAVDTGPAVVNRKAARLSGRNASQRGALVIDRFFETKEEALAWERAHPHFMTLRVVSGRWSPSSHPEPLVEQPQPNIELVTQAISAPAVAQLDAPPLPRPDALPPVAHPSTLPVALGEHDSPAGIAFRLPGRSLVAAPPSYHRRRFAAHASEETRIAPPEPTIRKLKRSRFA